jgi:hypothetical protein
MCVELSEVAYYRGSPTSLGVNLCFIIKKVLSKYKKKAKIIQNIIKKEKRKKKKEKRKKKKEKRKKKKEKRKKKKEKRK